MARKIRPPQYCHHKASGQATVRIAGKDHYLGPHGSKQSWDKYNKLVAEWFASGRPTYVIDADDPDTLPISVLLASFLRQAQGYYRRASGEKWTESNNYLHAMRPLKQLFGKTPAAEFSPKKLKAVRDEMIRMGWARNYINMQVKRIRRIFKWAVGEEMIPASVWHSLQSVESLAYGRNENVKESEPVKPVPDATVDMTLPHLPAMIADMVIIQRLTGCRAGELCRMRGSDIDAGGEVWTYTPPKHKTAFRGHERIIYIGPRGQAILAKYLREDLTGYVFKPQQSEQQRRDLQHQRRKTPIEHGNRPGSNRQKSPRWKPGEHYDIASYRRAIARACDKADAWAKGGLIVGNDERLVPRWHPHRLRHTAATEWRKAHGAEAALTMLGDKETRMIDVYAEKNHAAAMKIALASG